MVGDKLFNAWKSSFRVFPEIDFRRSYSLKLKYTGGGYEKYTGNRFTDFDSRPNFCFCGLRVGGKYGKALTD
jgi:hypothetical protein